MLTLCQKLGDTLLVEFVLDPDLKEFVLDLFLQAGGLVLWVSTLSSDRAAL